MTFFHETLCHKRREIDILRLYAFGFVQRTLDIGFRFRFPEPFHIGIPQWAYTPIQRQRKCFFHTAEMVILLSDIYGIENTISSNLILRSLLFFFPILPPAEHIGNLAEQIVQEGIPPRQIKIQHTSKMPAIVQQDIGLVDIRLEDGSWQPSYIEF